MDVEPLSPLPSAYSARDEGRWGQTFESGPCMGFGPKCMPCSAVLRREGDRHLHSRRYRGLSFWS